MNNYVQRGNTLTVTAPYALLTAAVARSALSSA